MDCGSDKVVVFEGSTSPDGRCALGWTLRPAHNPKPVDWSSYHRDTVIDLLEAYPYDPDAADPDYRLLDGVLDLRAKKFLPLASDFPYWPHKNHGELGVAWSHGSSPGRFAVFRNDARFYTENLWLAETGGAGVRVVDLAGPAEKIVRRFLRGQLPKKYALMAITYGDVSFMHDAAMIDFSAEIPKSLEDAGAEGTISVALPAGTITGVRKR